MAYGKKVWVFPDAELPPVGVNSIPGHESIIITNTGEQDAHVKITLIYTDREPADDLVVEVKARRVRCLRTNEENDFGCCGPDDGCGRIGSDAQLRMGCQGRSERFGSLQHRRF